MKTLTIFSLLLLTACSSNPPKLTLRPQPAPAVADNPRYPEIIRAYHIGRYADPNDDLVMHEQHVIYRVEENTRWDFRPGTVANGFTLPRDAAFNPVPVNDAILAEVNAQRLATAQIMAQARRLPVMLAQVQGSLQEARTNLQASASLRAALNDARKRLDALEAAQQQEQQQEQSSSSTTNAPADLLQP